MTIPNFSDDDLDGILFRFWIRAASSYGYPGEVAAALCKCVTEDDYRAALMDLARRKGVNLPTPGVWGEA